MVVSPLSFYLTNTKSYIQIRVGESVEQPYNFGKYDLHMWGDKIGLSSYYVWFRDARRVYRKMLTRLRKVEGIVELEVGYIPMDITFLKNCGQIPNILLNKSIVQNVLRSIVPVNHTAVSLP